MRRSIHGHRPHAMRRFGHHLSNGKNVLSLSVPGRSNSGHRARSSYVISSSRPRSSAYSHADGIPIRPDEIGRPGIRLSLMFCLAAITWTQLGTSLLDCSARDHHFRQSLVSQPCSCRPLCFLKSWFEARLVFNGLRLSSRSKVGETTANFSIASSSIAPVS